MNGLELKNSRVPSFALGRPFVEGTKDDLVTKVGQVWFLAQNIQTEEWSI